MRLKLIYILLLTTIVCFGTTTKATRVIDGDTFETATGEKVRLIGINAPEISDIFGQEAKQYLSDLIVNKTVDLQTDNISNDRDRYQRLLRYVILGGVDINKKMVSDGYAFAYLKYHFSKSTEYEQAQILSREANKGIWSNEKKEEVINQKAKKKIPSLDISAKKYFIVSVLVFLILAGIYYYSKR
ncbi:MAG: thermonuclease family protein [Chitinophagia bacterium]